MSTTPDQTTPEAASTWHPVASSDDATPRHVASAALMGRELALWRADDGFVNAWEDRCLHRGVRLSVGRNEGSELQCTYHGWRYASRTGGCTYIPAHPADAPARTICSRTFRSQELYGLVWVSAAAEGDLPTVPELDDGDPFPLRALPFNAPASFVLSHLGQYHLELPAPSADGADSGTDRPASVEATVLGPNSFRLQATLGDLSETMIVFVQPVDEGHSVVRAVLGDQPRSDNGLCVLRRHAHQLEQFRARVEALAADTPQPSTPRSEPEPEVHPEPVQAQVAVDGHLRANGQPRTSLRVVVKRKWITAAEIAAFELAPLEGLLPTAQPGAHIDVHLPNGLIRQYSLTNAAGDQACYTIGVKREPDSRGGSATLHETVREGDVLAISAPRNNFALRRDATRTVLIGGGIGITPLLAMAETLRRSNLDFELFYFARSQEQVAFQPLLDQLGPSASLRLGLDPAQTEAELRSILANYETSEQIYICGPGPMLDTTRRVAEAAGWSEDAIHFEYFKNNTEIDRSNSFEIELARSALTLDVGAEHTILGVLHEHGIPVESSCEQGACGTCVVGVVEGEPLHQDVYLKPSERRAGDKIISCVSRAKGSRLVLDI